MIFYSGDMMGGWCCIFVHSMDECTSVNFAFGPFFSGRRAFSDGHAVTTLQFTDIMWDCDIKMAEYKFLNDLRFMNSSNAT